ncbi:MAG: hypothetical protein ACI4F6_04470, partial [Acutalibacteraceae bacterium]
MVKAKKIIAIVLAVLMVFSAFLAVGTIGASAASGVVINGTKYHKGDVIQITVKHQADVILSGISGLITYDSAYLKLAGEYATNDSAFSSKLSASGSFMVNRKYETTGTVIGLSYAAMNAGTGYNFKTEDTLAVAQFEVIAESGTTSLTHAVLEEYDMDVNDYTGKTSYTVTLVSSDPTTTDPTTPTDPVTDPTTPVTDPTTPVTEPDKLTVNGTAYSLGDTITYTTTLQNSAALSIIGGYVSLSGSTGSLTLLTSSQSEACPNLTNGSLIVNFTPNNGSKAVYFNALEPESGFSFSTAQTLITLQYQVTAVGGSVNISTIIDEIYDLDTNTVTSAVVSSAITSSSTPTDPTETDPTETDPTETDPTVTDPTVTDPTVTDPTVTDPTVTDPVVTDPTVASGVVINGKTYQKGDVVQITVKHQADAILSGICGLFEYDSAYLALAGEFVTDDAMFSPKLSESGMFFVNREYEVTSTHIGLAYSAMNGQTGYDFLTEDTLAVAQFEVVAESGETSITHKVLEEYDLNVDNLTGETTISVALVSSAVKTYTVKYDANGGTGTMADTVATYGVTTAIPTSTFTYAGKNLAGWTVYRTALNQFLYVNGTKLGWYKEGEQPDGYTKYVYKPNAKFTNLTSVDGDTVVFYAQWSGKTYTVKYDANG